MLAIFSPLLATGPNFDPPFWPLKPQSNGGTPSSPHFPGLHADRAHFIPQGRRRRGRIPKLSHPHTAYLSLGTPISSHILTPYNPKPIVGYRHASLAYILRGSDASRKVENSEAASPNCVTQAILSPLFGYKAPLWAPFWPLISQSNEGTHSRPHTCLAGLHADRARCLP